MYNIIDKMIYVCMYVSVHTCLNIQSNDINNV